MLRAFIYGLTILHLGPGIAFALLAFGCDGTSPYLGAICSRSVFSSFVIMTVGGWLILGLGLIAIWQVQRTRRAPAPAIRERAASLLAVAVVGALLAAAGNWLVGGDAWVLAVPASVAVGWLFLANPENCRPPSRETDPAAGGGGGRSV